MASNFNGGEGNGGVESRSLTSVDRRGRFLEGLGTGEGVTRLRDVIGDGCGVLGGNPFNWISEEAARVSHKVLSMRPEILFLFH